MKDHKTDCFFEAKLGQFASTPSPDAWESIGQSLQKRRTLQRRKMLAVAASLILLVGLGFYFITGNSVNVLKVSDGGKAKSEIASNSPGPLDVNDNLPKHRNTYTKPQTRSLGLKAVNPSKKAMKPVREEVKPRQSPTTTKMPALSSVFEKTLEIQPLAQVGEPVEKNVERPKPDIKVEMAPTREIAVQNQEPVNENQAMAKDEKVKGYPTVKIIYKKTTQESPLASVKDNIVKKGVEKLSGFKDELKLSEGTKAKIRDTKEDILALNFGRIFNKTTKNDKN